MKKISMILVFLVTAATSSFAADFKHFTLYQDVQILYNPTEVVSTTRFTYLVTRELSVSVSNIDVLLPYSSAIATWTTTPSTNFSVDKNQDIITGSIGYTAKLNDNFTLNTSINVGDWVSDTFTHYKDLKVGATVGLTFFSKE